MFYPLRLTFIKSLIYKELLNYFKSPIAYVFLVIFLLLNSLLTMYIGDFLGQGQASLSSFFSWHPWIYLFLIPAIGMGIWSEDIRIGTIELLSSFPVSIGELVIGKFLGAWFFLMFSLSLTFPLPLTVMWLGNPDIGLIILGYCASICLSGVFLAITCITSALTRNQIISYILSLIICLFLIVVGNPLILEYLQKVFPLWLYLSFEYIGIQPHLYQLDRGILQFKDIFYFLSLIGISLYTTGLIVLGKRTG